jgi:DNA-binding NarL/FixJ family response regulator
VEQYNCSGVLFCHGFEHPRSERWRAVAAKRAHLSVERRVLLAVGEVGEVLAASGDWRSLVCDHARALTNAQMGVFCEVRGWNSEGHARPTRVTDTGLDNNARKIFLEYLSDQSCNDPFLQKIVQSSRVSRTWLRGRHVADDAWYTTAYVQDYRRRAQVDDMMLGVLAPTSETGALTIAVHRAWDAGAFTRADLEAMQLFQRTLQGWSHVLVGGGAQTTADQPSRLLSRRLQQVLALLVQGKSEKQVAAELGISQHTVHMHVGRLHKVLGVSNRAELVAAALR